MLHDLGSGDGNEALQAAERLLEPVAQTSVAVEISRLELDVHRVRVFHRRNLAANAGSD